MPAIKASPEVAEIALALDAVRRKYRQRSLTGQRPPDWEPYWYQIPPDDYVLNEFEQDEQTGELDLTKPVPWWCFCLVAGRGVGKTRTGAQFVIDHLRTTPNARVACGAPTIGDARSILAEGESGLITKFRGEFPTYNRSLLEATHVNGGRVFFMGSENPERWNGPQFTLLWADELALWNEASWDMALFTLRLSENPRCIVTTTPKNRIFVRNLAKESGVVVYDRIPTSANVHLTKRWRDRLYARYGGTRLGRQELEGEFIDDVEGALWKQEWIDRTRVLSLDTMPDIAQCVVAVDPAGSTGPRSADTGIVVAGRGVNGHYYVWIAEGVQMSPLGWAKRAIYHYQENEADCIVAERNYGGDLVLSNILTVDQNVPVTVVTASRGKVPRAQPIANLYEQNRVHHLGYLTDLEGQQTSYPVAETRVDILDAVVWALTYLLDPDSVPEDGGAFAQPVLPATFMQQFARQGPPSLARQFAVHRQGEQRMTLDPYAHLSPQGRS